MKIITVFKTHVDIGFTDLPQNVIEKYATNMLVDAVKTCEQTAGNIKEERFVWTLPAYPLHYALKQASEDVKKRCEKLILNDQLKWHALPFTLRTEFFTKDELRKTLKYAKELSETYNKPMPTAAKMTDVPGHTQAIVDVLCENGVKFLHLGCNPASTTPDVPVLFWWESKNKNRILVYYNNEYGSAILPPKGWKYPVHLAMIQTNDNCGVQSYTVIDELKQEALKAYPDAEFTTGTLDDFAEEILKCDLSDLKVIRGELGDSWIHALGAFPESTSKIREARRIFKELDKNKALEKNEEYLRLKDKYFENALLFGEHSGGVDTKKYLAKRVYKKDELREMLQSEMYMYANKGWNQEREWACNCLDAANEAKKLYALLSDEPVSVTDNAYWKVTIEKDFVVAYNKTTNEKITFDYLYEIIGKKRMEKYLDDYLTLKVDWSFDDFGRKYYPDAEEEEFGLILSGTNITDSFAEATYTVAEKSLEEYGNCKAIKIKAMVLDKQLKVCVELKDKEPTTYIEGGHFIMTFEKPFENIIVHKSGTDINPDTDVVLGANRGLFAVDEYVKVNGVTINPLHTPLVSFGESKIYRCCCHDYKQSKTPKVVFNLFNTMWGTGNPQWITGSDYKFEFLISN